MILHEVLDEVAAAKSRKDKSDVLLKHNCLFLRDFLRASFDEKIVWGMPDGSPPYTPSSNPKEYKSLTEWSGQLRYWLAANPAWKQTQSKLHLERQYVDMLQSVHPKDAELMIVMKDKKLKGKYKGLTEKLVRDTFPDLMPS